MNVDKPYFLQLAQYNQWANNKVIAWLQEISEAQFVQPIVSSFGSIAGNTIHMAATEKIWSERLHGNANAVWIGNTLAATKGEAIEAWQKATAQLKLFCENIDEDRLHTSLKFTRLSGDKNEMAYYKVLSHVFNHSTFHRGQFVILFRQVGYTKITETDLLDYYNKTA